MLSHSRKSSPEAAHDCSSLCLQAFAGNDHDAAIPQKIRWLQWLQQRWLAWRSIARLLRYELLARKASEGPPEVGGAALAGLLLCGRAGRRPQQIQEARAKGFK